MQASQPSGRSGWIAFCVVSSIFIFGLYFMYTQQQQRHLNGPAKKSQLAADKTLWDSLLATSLEETVNSALVPSQKEEANFEQDRKQAFKTQLERDIDTLKANVETEISKPMIDMDIIEQPARTCIIVYNAVFELNFCLTFSSMIHIIIIINCNLLCAVCYKYALFLIHDIQ